MSVDMVAKEEKLEEEISDLVSARYYSSAQGRNDVEITKNTDMRRELGFDSIMLVILQIEVEDRFHIRFNPVKDDLEKVFTTVQALSDYVRCLLREENGQ